MRRVIVTEAHLWFVALFVVADLDRLPKDEFCAFFDTSKWCHAYGADGARRTSTDIPKSLLDIADDPYRSLVGELFRAGGCAKSDAAFFGLCGPTFCASHQGPTGGKGFQLRLFKAIDLAKSGYAKSLPGWSGARRKVSFASLGAERLGRLGSPPASAHVGLPV